MLSPGSGGQEEGRAGKEDLFSTFWFCKKNSHKVLKMFEIDQFLSKGERHGSQDPEAGSKTGEHNWTVMLEMCKIICINIWSKIE